MKRTYVRPTMVGERFVANEYVAACGESGTVYKFKCDAGDDWGGYSVYLNGKDEVAGTDDDIFWCGGPKAVRGSRTYTKCGDTHEAEDNNDFYKGYIKRMNWMGVWSTKEVIVWTDNGRNTHCTTNLKMSEWETAKS